MKHSICDKEHEGPIESCQVTVRLLTSVPSRACMDLHACSPQAMGSDLLYCFRNTTLRVSLNCNSILTQSSLLQMPRYLGEGGYSPASILGPKSHSKPGKNPHGIAAWGAGQFSVSNATGFLPWMNDYKAAGMEFDRSNKKPSEDND
ncbi:hypothetical protein EWB00_001197 [Schistosoma japonicum]|uniref:Uncharacterized protein n=1 Tax=Schistosoma japonicum TaxID=6182 RepID=A0A4Z2CK29_SCHJA|nr:hypothetical protein EWB00_001197 [Schistosoma japonicum]